MNSASALSFGRMSKIAARFVGTPSVGPLLVLLAFGLIFSLTNPRFLATQNLSIILQQTVIIGTLAIGQTLIILTAGIDLAVGAICVLGTILAGKLANSGYDPIAAMGLAVLACSVAGVAAGSLISGLRLPPFIVTLGILGIITAALRLISAGGAFPVTDEFLGWTGNTVRLNGFIVTYGVIIMLLLYGMVWFLLNQTQWGRHVYAVGNNPEAARLVGIPVGRLLLSVYVLAAFIYGIAAWLALGRIPNADPNALQTANLDSITAVVIGGTSLFGGRGGLIGTLIGALIVGVLRNGLTLAGIDPLWQDLVTGILVIVAVALDQLTRGRR
ncbi:MAG: ABC transporter permease [Mesorhizobium sp.]|uniref:ABC transporter permease n=1 Tax=Mesorhizobium sp. TaxID=1871066 RepID=UPI000FD2C19A|nr:ABC transporter permease [Mesorhizobium sp.]RUU26653.1 ABC transporter permease [Mesorhizobium sp. M6A.T.Ca.TU.002.02.2.1]RWQ32881.1 MAG: ABC transporter permease [Mesorhizobium sp.]TIL26888.1 MAG: ABC transporter permease [Mesorhizobium sp.]